MSGGGVLSHIEADGFVRFRCRTGHAYSPATLYFEREETLEIALCRQQLLVEASEVKPQIVSEKSARYSREHVGNDFIGWLHFQTIYNQLTQKQPDMFD